MWQNIRSESLEILDLGPDHYTPQEYSHCLRQLGRINQWLGGFSATKKAFFNLKRVPESILEVGCGGGYLCENLTKWFPDARITGIDINEVAVEIAKKNNSSEKLKFEVQPDKTLKYADDQFDVVTTMLVCHHMKELEFIHFLKECYRISKVAVIINDLHRHFLAYVSFKGMAPIFFANRLIVNDGLLSIRRAFRKNDWHHALKQAGFSKNQYELKWNFPFRWTLTIKKYAD